MALTRRGFLRTCVTCSSGALFAPALSHSAAAKAGGDPRKLPVSELREASYWEPVEGGGVRCLICPNQCEPVEGEVTLCNTRMNRGGKLYTLTFGLPCVLNTDPLQKNPLYHVEPSSKALGVATAGCNLRCSYCQNWDISQVGPWKTKNMDVPPAELIRLARERDLNWITFSYTEPVAYYEYAIEIAELAKKAGMKVAVVTAGMISPRPLVKLVRRADAFSITLKGAKTSFYRDVCGSELKDVWRAIRMVAASGRWFEVVHLIVPTLNDSEKETRKIARMLASVDEGIPLHFLRFYPSFKLKHLPRAPIKLLENARAAALDEGLKFAYLDLPGHAGANTYCPRCGELLLERTGFAVLSNRIERGRCHKCREKIPGLSLSGTG